MSNVVICETCGQPLATEVMGRWVPCLCRCQETERETNRQKWQKQQKQLQIQHQREKIAGYWRKYPTLADDDGRNPQNSKFMARYVASWDKIAATGQGLVLYGPPGAGKTFMAAAICGELSEKRDIVAGIVSIPSLLDNIQSSSNAYETISSILAPDLLVFDDLGAEAHTPWRLEKLFELVDCRYLAKKPTFYTTNLTSRQLQLPSNTEEQRIYRRVLADGLNFLYFVGKKLLTN